MKTEENLQVSKLLSRSVTLPLLEGGAGCSHSHVERRISAHLLFPHLFSNHDTEQRESPKKTVPALATPSKPDVTPRKNYYFSPGRVVAAYDGCFQCSTLFFSPSLFLGRKVAFDMNSQPPAPKSSGKKSSASKSILKGSSQSDAIGSGTVGQENRAKMSLFTSPTKSPCSRRGTLLSPNKPVLIDISKCLKKAGPQKEKESRRSLPKEEQQEQQHFGDDQPPSGTPSRPSRVKSSVSRLGIDDIRLGEVISPSPRRLAEKHECAAEQPDLVDPVGNVPSSETSLSTPSRPSRAKSFVSRFGIDDIRLSDVVSPRGGSHVSSPARSSSTATPKVRKKLRGRKSRKSGLLKILFAGDEDVIDRVMDLQEHQSSREVRQQSCDTVEDDEVKDKEGKFWKVKSLVDTPDGRVKMSLQRKSKPQQKWEQPLQLRERKVLASEQRLSRNNILEIGISPDKLKRLMFDSPVSAKRSSRASDTAMVGAPGDASSSPMRGHASLTPVGLFDLTTSPLVDKRHEGKEAKNKKRGRKKLSY